MFGWGSKTQKVTKELSLAEKLSASTKKTRTDLSTKIGEITELAKQVCANVLESHAKCSVDAVCTLNFGEPKFAEKISRFSELTAIEKLKVVTDVHAFIKDGGVEVFQSGSVLTVKWNLVQADPVDATK